jgi:hypothetical protein
MQQAVVCILVLFLGGVFLTITVGLLTGYVNTRGLLYGRRADGSVYFSSARVQLLILTIGSAADYLISVLDRRSCALPEAPPQLVAMMGGSQLLYLAGKAWALLRKRSGIK